MINFRNNFTRSKKCPVLYSHPLYYTLSNYKKRLVGVLLWLVKESVDYDTESHNFALKETAEDQSKLRKFVKFSVMPIVYMAGLRLTWAIIKDTRTSMFSEGFKIE